MSSIREVNRFILEHVRDGKIDENMGLQIIRKVNNINEKKTCEIAIIGAECRFPGADDKNEYWNILKNGTNCSRIFPKNRADDVSALAENLNFSNCKGGYLDEVDKFDAAYFRLSPKEAMLMDPFQRIFLEVAYSAIEDAGYGGSRIANTRTGVFVGVDTSNKAFYMQIANENDFLTLTGSLNSILASRLPYVLNLRGPSIVIDTACSSGLVALHEACMALKNNECEMAVAGGINLILIPSDGGITSDMTSSDGETRAFDKFGKGFSWGEGVGVVFLKSLEKAIKDKDNIYAVIKGSAINNDGASNGITAPNPEAQTDVILRAWKEAEIVPETISYIEAHGTGTELGDPIEIRSLTDAFERFTNKKQFCGIGSVKTNIGHTVGASGMASLLKVILSLKNNQIPPTINFSIPNPNISFYNTPVFVNTKLRKWEKNNMPRVAGISSFGASGTNCHIVIEEAGLIKENAEPAQNIFYVMALSSKSITALKNLIINYNHYLEKNPNINLESLCYTANTGRGHYSYRMAFIFRDLCELSDKMKKLSGLNPGEADIEGVYYQKHSIVGSTKNFKELGEITEREKRELGIEAHNKIEEFINSGRCEKKLLNEVCELYVKGAAIEWDTLYREKSINRISLPVYPFDKVRFWVETSNSSNEKAYDKNNVYFDTFWRNENLTLESFASANEGTLIVKDSTGIGDELARALRAKGENVIEAKIGSHYERIGGNEFLISGSEDDYNRLFSQIKETGFSRIIHLATMTGRLEESKSCDQLDETLQLGAYGLFYIIKTIARNNIKRKMDIVLVSDYANEVTGQEPVLKPENATLFGFGKVISIENSNIQCRCIDIDVNTDLDSLISEIKAGYTEYHVAYRNGTRYVEELKQINIKGIEDNKIEIKENGAYIITGGTGGIGLEIGKYLAGLKKVNLALIARTQLPERKEWDRILSSGENTALCRKIKGIMDIEAMGTDVSCYKADISKYEQVDAFINDVKNKYGKICGIFHCAGIPGEKITINKQASMLNSVLSPKVQGTWLIDNLTRADKPDFFVMCSSIATLLPSVGQADYIAANSYLDSYEEYRRRFDKKTLTINWPLWKETGMGFNLNIDENEEPCKAMSTSEAISRLNEVLNKSINKIIIFEPNPNSGTPVGIGTIPVKIGNHMAAYMSKFIPQAITEKSVSKALHLKGREDGGYTETELQVASIWSDVLGNSNFSIFDIFYELGGDSIQAIKIANTINKVMGKDVQASDIFEHLTVSDLAEYLDKDAGISDKPVEFIQKEANPEDSLFDLSNSQERFWFLQKFEPDLVAYNMSVSRILDSEVDINILNKAMNKLIERHDALRTVFKEINGIPKQVVLNRIDFNVDLVDISNQEDNEELLRKLINEENKRPTDLSKPIVRMKLFKLSKEKHCIYFNIHHIIVDGLSMGIIERELLQMVDAYGKGLEPDLKPINTRYSDIITQQRKWLETPEAKRMEENWLNELAAPLPVLNLPIDYQRPKFKTYNGDYIIVKLEVNLVERLKFLSKEIGSTLHILLLSIYFVLLYKITNDDDIIVGVPIAQRDTEELDNVVGLLLNTISIRGIFTEAATFRDILVRIRDKSIKGYKNGKYPFDLIVSKINPDRDTSRSPIFSTIFQYFDNLQTDNENGSAFDLSLQCKETSGAIEARFDYNTDLFKSETVARLGGYFYNIVNQVIENPNIGLSDFNILSRMEKEKLLVEFNKTRVEYPAHKTIHELFEEQVERTPESTALVFGDSSLTYRELNEKANQLANTLRTKGVCNDCIVGIMTRRSFEMMIGILGILKAGGAYLPIDPDYPQDRVQYMLEDSGALLLLTQHHLKDKAEFKGEIIELESDVLYSGDISNLMPVNKSGSLAYVIYTSGSTGKPKGVMIEHRAVNNFIKGVSDIIDFSQGKTILSITTMSFDIFVLETLLPLTKGLKVVIACEEQQIDPKELNKLMIKNKVEMMQTTPSRMQLIMSDKNSLAFLESLKEIMIGGEAFPDILLERLKKLTRARVFNMYGPTETTIWSTIKELTHEGSINIGSPIANTRIYILDKNNNLQPIGIAGELYIGGDGLARGYLGNAELTKEKFLPNPLIPGEIIYRTGDIARWLPDGNIECLGRIDHQVKIRGYRIELGEVESCLLKHEAVKEAALTAREDKQRNKYLCAYYTGDRELSVNELKEHLSKELPDYMIPSYFIRLGVLPSTPNGKIDRKALPEPGGGINTGVEYAAPSNDMEKELLEIWKEILETKDIGVNHNFFDVGGNSLLIVQLYARIESKYPGRLTVPDLFNYSTISKLAGYLKKDNNGLPVGNMDSEKVFEDEVYTMFDEIEKGNLCIADAVQKLIKEGEA